MKILDAFKIAFTHMLSRRLRSWLTLIGIFAGIAAVVSLVSLGQGMQDAINDQFAGLGVNTLTIQNAGVSYGPPGTTNYGELTDHDISLLQRISGVDYAIPRYIESCVIEKNDIQIYGYAASIPGGEERDIIIKSLGLELEDGTFFDTDSTTKLVMGYSIAHNDDYTFKVGDKVQLQGETFRISGILKKKGNPMVDSSILVSTDTIEEFFNVENDYDLILVVGNEQANIDELQASVEHTLRTDRGQVIGEENFEVSSMKETLASLNSILTTVQVLLVGLAAISLLVGGIGIANTMYTAVLERRSEIGIMKAVGATNLDILTLFLIESGSLGLVGGLLGLLLGITISKSVEFAAYQYFGESLIQASIPIFLVIGSLLFAFLVGALSGTLPARSAAKMKVVDTFRD